MNGEQFLVTVSYGDSPASATPAASAPAPKPAASSAAVTEVLSPIGGKFFKTKDSSETALNVGDVVKEGQIVGHVKL